MTVLVSSLHSSSGSIWPSCLTLSFLLFISDAVLASYLFCSLSLLILWMVSSLLMALNAIPNADHSQMCTFSLDLVLELQSFMFNIFLDIFTCLSDICWKQNSLVTSCNAIDWACSLPISENGPVFFQLAIPQTLERKIFPLLTFCIKIS